MPRETYRVSLTVHDVDLQKPLDGTFLMTWKCGHDAALQTNRQVATESQLLYQHTFTFSATFSISSSRQLSRKIGKLKLTRFQNPQVGKTYAKAEFDLSIYVSASAAMQTKLTMETPHRAKPVVNCTISAVAGALEPRPHSGPNMTDNDLTTDRLSSWDVSAACDAAQFQTFVAERRMNHQAIVRLDLMVGPSGGERPANVRGPLKPSVRPPVVGCRQQQPTGKTLVEFIEASAKAPQPPRDPLADPAKLLERAAVFSWCEDCQCDGLQAAAPLFAALLQSKVFDGATILHRRFRDLIGVFMTNYEQKKFIGRAAVSTDFLVTTLYLIGLLRCESGLDKARVQMCANQLIEFATTQLQFICNVFAEPFLVIGSTIISQSFDIDRSLFLIGNRFRTASLTEKVPPPVRALIERRIINIFDEYLVKRLLDHPQLTSVMKCAEWKTLVSRLTLPYELRLLDQACSVVVLSNRLCDLDCENMCQEVCPDLPKRVVLTLLKNQVLDEFITTVNNTTIFEEVFRSELKTTEFDLSRPINPDLDAAVRQLDITEWKGVVLSEAALAAFPFMSDYFTVH
jgi:hypothetical protein